MNTDLTSNILNILKEEIVPAEGCTEPIALAFAGAKLKKILGSLPEKVEIYLSGNIIKNVKSVIVPNSGGMAGIEVAIALGIIAGDSNKNLLVISDVPKDLLPTVKNYLSKISVYKANNDLKLYIKIVGFSGENSASIEIKHLHTNITKIEKNGHIILENPCNDGDFNSSLTDRKILTVKRIYDMAKSIDITLIKPIFSNVILYNSAIAEEGLKESYGVNIGKNIMKAIEEGYYGNDLKNKCAAFASAGSDARMSGCPLPVMTTSGSGNQGMTASLPVIKYCIEKNIDEDTLIRALFVSHLTTIHIKTNVGRLSAYCGAICASGGIAAAIAFLNNESYDVVANSISNTLGNLSGVICDGAKASCAMKIASSVYAAFDGYLLAKANKNLKTGDGIIGTDIEDTIKNVGILASKGMKETDNVILNIMISK
ncbi:serine dehydratase subunit alpha family protein [Cetobacterium sp. SF1]|uniref:L-cysteine desulfidase family protein n=1 Tax=Cetobacterium sp. SF1 TaxID=3417654 RepID=UPI003CF1A495